MIRDHALHLYFFVLPTSLGSTRSSRSPTTLMTPATRSCTIPSTSSGWARTSATPSGLRSTPWPTVGIPEDPDPAKFPDLSQRLEAIRPQVLRGIETFFEWDASLVRNTDYLGLRNETRFDFLEGDVVNSNGRRIARGVRELPSVRADPPLTRGGGTVLRYGRGLPGRALGAGELNWDSSTPDGGRCGRPPSTSFPSEQHLPQQPRTSDRDPAVRGRRHRYPEHHRD